MYTTQYAKKLKNFRQYKAERGPDPLYSDACPHNMETRPQPSLNTEAGN